MRRWGPLGLATLAMLAYAGVWGYGFASDDVALVDRLMRQGYEGIRPFLHPATGAIGSAGYEAYFRPMWVLLTAADYALWGTWAGGYHLTNWLLFAALAALVGKLAHQVTGDARAAWWAGAIFAVHPIHTLNVIWISGRTDALAALGVVGALSAGMAWRTGVHEKKWPGSVDNLHSGRQECLPHPCQNRKSIGGAGIPARPKDSATGPKRLIIEVFNKARWLLVALGAGLIGLAGKEMAYLLPLLFLVTEWTRLRMQGSARPMRGAARASVPFFSLVVLWGGVVLAASPFVGRFDWSASPGHVLTNWAGALVLLVFPFDYEPLVRFWLGRGEWLFASALGVALLGAALGALALAAVWRLRKSPAIFWGALWVGIALVPLYRLTMRWYLLLPSVGMCLALGFGIRRLENLRTPYGVCGTVVGVLLFVSYAGGLLSERMKWARADAVENSALRSLVTLSEAAPTPHRLVLTASPAKVARMPVFGGNTESFLRVAGVVVPDVRVLTTVALDNPDAEVRAAWMDSARLRVEIAPGDGEFLTPADYLAVTRRRRLSVGDHIPAEVGVATVLALDADGRPIALEVKLDEPANGAARWGHFSRGRFVPFNPPPSGPEL